MSLELSRPLLSVGMLAAIATGHPYPMDANGYGYLPAPGLKRPARRFRCGRFTKQRAACRRGMSHRHLCALKRAIKAEEAKYANPAAPAATKGE